jgi:TPR repeat protein/AcrR family transcriptional regulator
MAKTLSQDKKDRSRPWQRAATRAAILDAARKLIERVGTDHLSLTAVAREADFAPATVFAYFANKNDLFLSVLAGDLANFARTMRREGPVDEETAEEIVAVPEDAAVAEPFAARAGEDAPRLRLVEAAQFDPDLEAEAGEPTDWASQEEIATLLRDELSRPVDQPEPAQAPVASGDANAPADIMAELAQLHEAVARLEARPVDQWLERRLREFERGLAALEQRPEKAEMATALAALDETLRKLGTRVDAIESRQAQTTDDVGRTMRERSEQVEKRLREFLSDVEAANARAGTRLNALENAAFAAAPEFFHSLAGKVAVDAPAHVPAVAQAVAEPLSAEPAKDAAPDAVAAPIADSGESYLSVARRSAQAAAQDTEKKPRAESRARSGVSRRTLYMIATGLGLAVALIWTGVFVKALAVPAPNHTPQRIVLVAKAQKLALKSDPLSSLVQEARSGNAKAQLVLALDLLDGPRRNDALAARWLTVAAQQGEAVAAFKLATMYRSGHGVTADAVQSFRWFETAARKGNCKAMQDLAVAYAEGWGTDKNPSEAARWFTRAAGLGLMDAQFNLGVLYEEGQGVPQSLLDAYKWYLVAAGAGDHEAEARVGAIKPQLSSSDVAAAEEAAASFKPAPLDQDANTAPSVSPSSAG